MPAFALDLLPETLAVCRLDPGTPLIPVIQALPEGFLAVVRTAGEVSVVCPQAAVPAAWREPPEGRVEPGWRAFMVRGPLEFSLTGVLASLAGPLAAAGVSLFAVSTFDTDYVLVREAFLEKARAALAAAGHELKK